MRKTFTLLFLLSLLVPTAYADPLLNNSKNASAQIATTTAFSNQTSAYTGSAFYLGGMMACHTWTAVIAGVPTAVNVGLQGSLDDSFYATLDNYTGKTSTLRPISAKGVKYVRGKVTTFTNGTSVTVKFSSKDGGC